MGRRIIIYPQGLPASGQQELCNALTLHCGGDLSRVFERAGGSLAGFLDYAMRLRVMLDRREEALVVLTRTNPLALLLPARRALEQALPTLGRSAAWALYWDPSRDPDLLERASHAGTIDAPDAEAPIWTAANKMSFLLLSPRVFHMGELDKRVGALLEKPQRRSGIQKLGARRIADRLAAGEG